MTAVSLVLESPADPVATDLAAALEHECAALGAEVVPDGIEGAVPVLLGPRAWAPRAWDPAALGGAVLVDAAPPGTRAHDDTIALARASGAPVLSPDGAAVRELRDLGLAAERLEVGPSAAWDRPGPADLDVALVAPFCFRRAALVARAAELLDPWRCALHLPDDLDPPVDAAAVLARARVALLLHDADWPAFAWVRAAQAVQHGCAIVTEPATDVAPLDPGVTVVAGRGDSAALLAVALLEDEGRRAAQAAAAAEALGARGGMRAGAERLLALAADRAAGAGPIRRSAPAPVAEVPPPPDVAADAADAERRARAKADRLAMIEARRAVARARAGDRAGAADVVAATPAWEDGPAPEVSVLVSVFDHAEVVAEALASVGAVEDVTVEVVVVDDGSTDGSARVVRRWMDAAPDVPAVLLRHVVNQGLPAARNRALAHARAPLAFVLDSDNAVLPRGLVRLRDALDAEPAAVLAYGMLAMFDERGPHGLRSRHPWSPARLRHANPIDAMALVRADAVRALGGWTDDPRLHGWEDYDLWCAVAESGGHGTFVPAVVARYRVSPASMSAGTTDLSTRAAYEALVERHPRLMAGVVPPRA